MFSSIGGPEIVLIFIVALLVFGPKKLPEIGQKIGRVIGEIRRATGELRTNVEREIGVDPLEGVQRVGRAGERSSARSPTPSGRRRRTLMTRGLPREATASILRDVKDVDPSEGEKRAEDGDPGVSRNEGREGGESSGGSPETDPASGSRKE
jgi:sec-independent protein translocase protein TatA